MMRTAAKTILLGMIGCTLLAGCRGELAAPTCPVTESSPAPRGEGQCDAIHPAGDEGTLIEEYLGDHTAGTKAEAFANSLDQALAVLIARCCPPPQLSHLARAGTSALCDEWQRQRGQALAESHRQRWAQQVEETRSFEGMLQELAHLAPAGSPRELTDAGLRGLLAASGWRAACVLTAEQTKDLDEMQAARESPDRELGKLGLILDQWPVVDVVPQSAAAEEGVTAGDTILSINGQDVSRVAGREEAFRLLAGPVGQPATLTVRRGNAELDIRVVRASAGATRVTATLLDSGVLCVRVPTLEGSGIADKVRRLIRSGYQVSAVILDLRDNPGGRPEEANAIANLFLDDRLLQIWEFRSGKRIGIKANGVGALTSPLVVLTNRNTGSGAELVAMALRDNGRATLVGESTAGALFGKDIQKLKDDRVIVFRSEPLILSPTGRDYSANGIPPDIELADERGTATDAILSHAVQAVLLPQTAKPDSQPERPPAAGGFDPHTRQEEQ